MKIYAFAEVNFFDHDLGAPHLKFMQQVTNIN